MTVAGATRRYSIPDGRAVNIGTPGGGLRILKGPRVITQDEIPDRPGWIAGLIKSGFLVELGDPQPDPEGLQAQIIGHDSVRPRDLVQGESMRLPQTRGEEVGVKSPKSMRLVNKSRFDLDPGTLKGKSLEDLNLMVKDRDARYGPYATEVEAIAKLTQDHGK